MSNLCASNCTTVATMTVNTTSMAKGPNASRTKRQKPAYSLAKVMERERPVKKVLERLANVVAREPGQWTACCPAHCDGNPSLSVHENEDGKVLLHCHAGCEYDAILEAMGLDEMDLFPQIGIGKAPRSLLLPDWETKSGISEKIVAKKPTSNSRALAKPQELVSALDSSEDWAALVREFREALSAVLLNALAEEFLVSPEILQKFHVGWRACTSGGKYTFPEMNAAGEVVGISTRAVDGSKRFLRGGQRGLYLPDGWEERDGPVLIVEGVSDTAALTGMGLAGIGRFSCTGGSEYLAELLTEIPVEREIVVIGEIDAKSSGRWPGKDGAIKLADELAERLDRNVRWTLPPDGAKDTRAWLRQHQRMQGGPQ
jgi:hypothetical protein